MDFEQELSRMVDIMTAQSGRIPNRIVMHPDTARAMVSNTSDLAEGGVVGDGSIARYNGIPIVLSEGVEQDKFYLVPGPPMFDGTYDSGYDAWWVQSPDMSSPTAGYTPQQWQSASSVSFKIDTYDAKKPDEEPDEIDESSFMDILNAME